MDRVGEASEAGKHRMVGRSGTSATQAKPPATTAEEAKLGNSAPSEQSWLGSLGIWGQGHLQQPNCDIVHMLSGYASATFVCRSAAAQCNP